MLNSLVTSIRPSACLFKVAREEAAIAVSLWRYHRDHPTAALSQPLDATLFAANSGSKSRSDESESNDPKNLQHQTDLSAGTLATAWLYSLIGLLHFSCSATGFAVFALTPVTMAHETDIEARKEYSETMQTVVQRGNVSGTCSTAPGRTYYGCISSMNSRCSSAGGSGSSTPTPTEHSCGAATHSACMISQVACSSPRANASRGQNEITGPASSLERPAPRAVHGQNAQYIDASGVQAVYWKAALLLLAMVPAGLGELVAGGDTTTNDLCPCAYARLAGIERAMPCSEDFQDVTTQDLFAVKWPEAMRRFSAQFMSERLALLVFRLALLYIMYQLSRTSTNLQSAM